MVNRRQLLKLSALGTASFAAPLAYSASKITMAYNTGNPPGSTSPKDLIDNAEDLDFLMTGSGASHPNRLGVPLKSWKGMEGEHNADQARRESEFDADQNRRESEFDEYQARHESEFDAAQIDRATQFNIFMDASGYEDPIPYAPGILLPRVTKTVLYLGNIYRVRTEFMPLLTTNWATDGPKLKLIGDDSLRQNLANKTNPALGSGLVGHKGRTVAASLENFLHAADLGVVGDLVADDTAAFIAACAKSVAMKKPLYLGSLKPGMFSQTSTIPTDGLTIIADNTQVYTPPAVFDVLLGNVGMAPVLADAANAQMAVIYSSFNGPVFSGKRLDFKNICIICDYSKANSSAFAQSTPTSYPGWSNGLDSAENVGAYYTGSHGIELKGGWEIGEAKGLRTGFNGGIGLYIHETPGVNSPIEYITFDDTCAFFWGLLGNVVIDGARKHVHFGKVMLNNAGQVRLAVDRNPSFTIDSEDDIVYAISMVLDGQASIETITFDGIYGEEVQGLLKTTGNFANNIILKSSYIIPMSNGIVPGSSSWLWRNASFEHNNSSHMKCENNASLAGSALIRFANHSSSTSILIDLKETIIGTLSHTQRRGYLYYDETSGTIGDGTANTFTSAMAQIFTATGLNEGARHAVYLITANFQGSGSTNGGGYLMAVTRQNSGNYFAVTWAGGSTTGFTSAPTISASGVISLPLAASYRARINRLDHSALTF